MTKDKEHTNQKIIFISSYPKSGKTCIRILIGALLNQNKGIFSLKDLEEIKLFSQIIYFLHFDNLKYQKNGNLDFNFVVNNWINAQKRINQRAQKVRFFKTHSIRGIINGNFFTNETVCLGFIYIIRDPRDIVISVANHAGITIDKAIEIMLFNNKFMTTTFQVDEPVGTWENHLDSWIKFKSVSNLIIKYEDIINNTSKILNQIIDFLTNTAKLKIKNNRNLVGNVLQSTSFDRLQQLEKDSGFKEASSYSKFFREGKSEQWKSILNINQIKLIEKELYKPMSRLGYI